MKERYPVLRENWTVKGGRDERILFSFRRGLCEERFFLSQEAYTVLRHFTGENSCTAIERITGIDPIPYAEHLVELGIVELLESTIGQPRQFLEPYEGENLLGRIMLHITGRCNLQCKHCYLLARDWGNELAFTEIVNLADQATELNVASVSITGGEPFIRGDLLDILRLFDEREIKIEGIFTNATIVPDAFLDAAGTIQEFPYFVSINGSFAGSHDRFIGTRDSFDQTIDAIHRMTDGGIKVFANTTLSAYVESDQQVRDFYNLIKALRIYHWRVSTPFLEGGWKDNYQRCGISIERELQTFLILLQMWLDDGRPFDIELGHIFRYIDGQYSENSYTEADYVCDYFRERIVVLPNGDVSACPLIVTHPLLVGNIRKQSLHEIWESKAMRYFKDLRVGDIITDKCRSCSKLSKCGIGCRANSVLMGKEYTDIDPEICAIYLNPLYDTFVQRLQEAGITKGNS